MTKNVFTGIGVSKNDDSFKAGEEAAKKAIDNMKRNGGSDPIFGIVFCSGSKYGKDEKTMKKFVDGVQLVFSKFKNMRWIGCTTAGEITNDGVEHASAVASVISTKYIKFGVGVGEEINANAFGAGKDAVDSGLHDLKMDKHMDSYVTYLSAKTKTPSELIKQKQFAVLTLPAGFTLKESGWEDDMLEGIKSVVSATTPIVGGSAADDVKFLNNYQFENGNVHNNSVVLAVIFSNVKLGFGIEHGFKPTKKIVLITKAKGNIVYELNGKPAVDVYADMLGIDKKELLKGTGFLDLGKKLPDRIIKWAGMTGISPDSIMKKINFYKLILQNPFGIPDINGNYLTRVPKGIVDGKYIEFYNKMFNNMPLALLEVDEERTFNSPKIALGNAIKDSGKPALSIIFDCVGRSGYLGVDKMDKMYKETKDVLEGTPKIGFFSVNEQGFEKNSAASGHTFTCSVMTIGDKLITDK